MAGSSESSKYEFLEKKGLTKAEIEEAFRRARLVPSSQPVAPPPPAAAPPAGAPPPSKPWEASTRGPAPGGPAPPQKHGLRLSQAVLLLGAAGGAAYCFRNYLEPFADAVRLALGNAPAEEPEEGEEASEAGPEGCAALGAGSGDGAAADGGEITPARSGKPEEAVEWEGAEEMRASLADVKAMVSDLAAKSPGPVQLENEIASLREDVQAIVAALKNPTLTPPPASPGSREGAPSSALSGEDGSLRSLMSKTRESLGGGEALTPATLYSPAAPRTLSPSPLPSPVVGGSAGVPMSSPNRTGSRPFGPAGGGDAAEAPAQAEGSAPQTPGEPPRPHSYMEVLEMLEQGKTPPGIRTDINDKPPNPSLEASSSALSPRAKPWERAPGPGGSPLEVGAPANGSGESPEQGSPGGGGASAGSRRRRPSRASGRPERAPQTTLYKRPAHCPRTPRPAPAPPRG